MNITDVILFTVLVSTCLLSYGITLIRKDIEEIRKKLKL